MRGDEVGQTVLFSRYWQRSDQSRFLTERKYHIENIKLIKILLVIPKLK